eukprot:1158596-Pelagomonas_calceolata.AAC.3
MDTNVPTAERIFPPYFSTWIFDHNHVRLGYEWNQLKGPSQVCCAGVSRLEGPGQACCGCKKVRCDCKVCCRCVALAYRGLKGQARRVVAA